MKKRKQHNVHDISHRKKTEMHKKTKKSSSFRLNQNYKTLISHLLDVYKVSFSTDETLGVKDFRMQI